MFKKVKHTVLILISFISFISHSPVKADNSIVVAIIQDGPSDTLNNFSNAVKKHILTLAEGSLYNVEFKNFVSQNWSIDELKVAITNQLNDPTVDYIFLSGFMGAKIVSTPNFELNKPVLSYIIQKSEFVDLSSNEYFSYLQSPQSFKREIEVFSQEFDFKTLHVVIDEKIFLLEPQLKARIENFNNSHKFSIETLSYNGNIKELLKQIKKEKIEAVYLTLVPRMSQEERLALITSLNDEKIPSFSGLGVQDLEMGALMTITPDSDDRIARRIALNIHQMQVLDKELKDISPFVSIPEKLSINSQTADLLEYYPSFSTEISADMLFKVIGGGNNENLNLNQALLRAGKENINLSLSAAELKESGAIKRRSLSGMLPQARITANFTAIEEDRALASQGGQARSQTGIGINLRQMLFDDEVITNYRQARKNFQGQKFLYDLSVFDAMADAGRRFLQYASDLELLKIEIENMNLVQSNLDLAENRFKVGRAGKEEIFRWRSEKARAQSSVLQQEALANQSLIALNQSLNLDQETQWNIKNDIDAENYGPLDSHLKSKIDNRKDMESFRKFLVGKAFEFSPELASIKKQIEAQKLKINRFRRRFILPSVYGDFGYQRLIQQDRLGDLAELREETDENQLSLAINAEYSLFEGGGKFFDIQREKAILKQLEANYERSKQLIEQETLANVYAIKSSAPNIFLTRESAENAVENLDLIRDKYARGAIDIITLLDAQNNAIAQKQTAAIAEFNYLADVISLQRAISWFEVNKSEQEKAEMLDDFIDFRKRGNK